jgi:hypothetical protein
MRVVALAKLKQMSEKLTLFSGESPPTIMAFSGIASKR